MGVFEGFGLVGRVGTGQYGHLSARGLSALPYPSRASQGEGDYDFPVVPFASLDEFPAYDNGLADDFGEKWYSERNPSLLRAAGFGANQYAGSYYHRYGL